MQEKEGAGWKEEQRPADTSVIALSDLAFGEDYRIEVKAVNANGSSIPAELSFSVSKQPGAWTYSPPNRTFQRIKTLTLDKR